MHLFRIRSFEFIWGFSYWTLRSRSRRYLSWATSFNFKSYHFICPFYLNLCNKGIIQRPPSASECRSPSQIIRWPPLWSTMVIVFWTNSIFLLRTGLEYSGVANGPQSWGLLWFKLDLIQCRWWSGGGGGGLGHGWFLDFFRNLFALASTLPLAGSRLDASFLSGIWVRFTDFDEFS